MDVKKFSVTRLTIDPRGGRRRFSRVLEQLYIQEMSWNVQAIPYKPELELVPNTSPFGTTTSYIYIVYIYINANAIFVCIP